MATFKVSTSTAPLTENDSMLSTHMDAAKRAIDKLDAAALAEVKRYIRDKQLNNPSLAPPSPLLDLPAELRNRIWAYTESLVPTHFKGGKTEILTWDVNSDLVRPPGSDLWDICWFEDEPAPPETYTRVSQPPITRTCRTLRAETLPIFYGANTFRSLSTTYFRAVQEHIKLFKQVKIGHGDVMFFLESFFADKLNEAEMKVKLREFEVLGFNEGVLEPTSFFKKRVRG